MKQRHPYDPDCPDCKPAVIDMERGEPMADDHPKMKQIMAMWEKQPFAVREAFIEVTANNSRRPEHMLQAQLFVAVIEGILSTQH